MQRMERELAQHMSSLKVNLAAARTRARAQG